MTATAEYFTVPRHLNTKTLRRIFSKVQVDSATGCWNWTAGLSQTGYGKTSLGSEFMPSHRLLYAWLVEPLPRGNGRDIQCLDHLCRNPRCCNPAHLELVSAKENLLRGEGACAKNARKTHCQLGHELPTTRIDSRGRTCPICARETNRQAYLANRAAVLERTARNALRRMNGPRREELLEQRREHYHATKQLKRGPAKRRRWRQDITPPHEDS